VLLNARPRFADLSCSEPARANDIALRGIRITSRLAGLSERTTVEQTFANRGDRPLEPIYTFPLPDGAAVCGFQIVTNDRVLTGVVEPVDAAQAIYDASVERGDGAYLLEHERDDVFTVRLGALKPGQVATLRIDYVRELTVVDRRVRFELPTTLAPRYASGDGMEALDALLEADAVNPPKAHAVPYGLTCAVDIDLGRAVTVTSPTHAIRRDALSDTRCCVTLAAVGTAPDRAVVLDIALAGEDQPRAAVEKGPDGAHYVTVSFLPELPELSLHTSPADVVFLIDCSGSMDGESIAQARNALELCLRSLKRGDHYWIVRFGSTHVALSPEPLIYNEQTLAATLAQVRGIEADLGGTELLDCLRGVLTTPHRGAERPRQVLLLTDGQVSNEDATIALARDHAATHRIFAFGIGPASSQTLCNGLARVTAGTAEFVAYGERIEEKVLRTFSRLDAPRVDEVTVDIGQRDAEPGAAMLPPVFDGDALTVHLRCLHGAPELAVLQCRIAGAPMRFEVPLPACATVEGAAPRLWARQRIRELEDRMRGTPAASRFTKSRDDHRATQLVALSRTFGILCTRTSFVAVEHRSLADRARGEPEMQRVPVMMPVGWGREDHFASLSMPPASLMRSATPVAAPPSASMSLRAPGGTAPFDRLRKSAKRMFGGENLKAPELAESAAPADSLFALLASQTAAGDFANPAGWLDADRLAATRAIHLPGLPARGAERTRNTLCALACLDRDHGDRRVAWRRAAAKARAFVLDATGWGEVEFDAALALVGALL